MITLEETFARHRIRISTATVNLLAATAAEGFEKGADFAGRIPAGLDKEAGSGLSLTPEKLRWILEHAATPGGVVDVDGAIAALASYCHSQPSLSDGPRYYRPKNAIFLGRYDEPNQPPVDLWYRPTDCTVGWYGRNDDVENWTPPGIPVDSSFRTAEARRRVRALGLPEKTCTPLCMTRDEMAVADVIFHAFSLEIDDTGVPLIDRCKKLAADIVAMVGSQDESVYEVAAIEWRNKFWAAKARVKELSAANQQLSAANWAAHQTIDRILGCGA